MALSFKEKLHWQGEINGCISKLKEKLSFKDRRDYIQRLLEALKNLGASINKAIESIYDRLVKGEFLKEPLEKFCQILLDAYKEIQDVEKLKAPTIRYVEANRNRVVNDLLESGTNLGSEHLNDFVLEGTEINFEDVLKSPDAFIAAIKQMQGKLKGCKLTLTANMS